jgi:hypothetical protein
MRPEWLGRRRQVKEMFPAVNLLYVTTNSAADVAAEALRRGASGYLPNSFSARFAAGPAPTGHAMLGPDSGARSIR